jgi:hypothetical protein
MRFDAVPVDLPAWMIAVLLVIVASAVACAVWLIVRKLR